MAIWSRRGAKPVAAHVQAVDRHLPSARVVQARYQAHQSRLPCAREPDERDHLAGLGDEGDVLQDLGAVRVGEADALESHFTADAIRRDRIRRLEHLGLDLQRRTHPSSARHGALQLPARVCDGGQRPVDGAQIRKHHGQLPDRHLLPHHLEAADDQDQRGAQDGDGADRDPEE